MTTIKAKTLRLLAQVSILEGYESNKADWVDLVLKHSECDLSGYEVTQFSTESMLWNPKPDTQPDSDSDLDTLCFYLHELAWKEYNDKFYSKTPELVFVVTLIHQTLDNNSAETERVYIWDDDDQDDDWYSDDYWDQFDN